MKVYIVCRDYNCPPIVLVTTNKELAERTMEEVEKSSDRNISVYEEEVFE
jgi:hypothetical protein